MNIHQEMRDLQSKIKWHLGASLVVAYHIQIPSAALTICFYFHINITLLLVD